MKMIPDKRIEHLLRRYAPPAFLHDEDAIEYLRSVVSDSDTNMNNEDDLTILIDQFFSEYRDGDDGDARKLARSLLKDKTQHDAPSRTNETAQVSQGGVPPSRIADATLPLSSEPTISTPTYLDRSEEAEAKKKARERKKAERQQKRKSKMRKNKVHCGVDDQQPNFTAVDATTDSIVAKSTQELEDMDDHGSAWAEINADGKDNWGGRGYGGRGVHSGANTASNIHLSGVSLQYAGNDLLQNATIQINGGHRYGLIGRNGSGKSTLLRRLANKSIPGFPRDCRVLLVKQEVEGTDKSALQTLLDADVDLTTRMKEQAQLEEQIEKAVYSESDSQFLAEAVERLGTLASELDAMDADGAEERAKGLLRGLQFTDRMMEGPTNHLSGGWRMRLAIAQSLFVTSDLLLMDEPSNHLDTTALIWLAQYLSESNHTLIVVSHDRGFLDDVSTDIMLFEHKKLSYHVGNYSDFQQQQDEKHARQAQILDASERKRAKAISFIEQQQKGPSKKYQDPKKQRQAKMMKEKKLDRIGNYREDGKKYKTRSIKKLSEEYSRCPEKLVVEADEPVARLKLFNPTWPPGITPGSPLIQANDMSFSYERETPWVLQNLTLDINRGSKVSIVGENGSGKSTLMNILTGKLSPEDEDLRFKGELWTHPCLRIGHVTQHSVELLDEFGSLTVEEYGEKELLSRNACAGISSSASGSKNIRQYLGAFGLGGPHAKRLIGTLSGGERMRLCFATVMAEQPHLLCLDEPSNHLDMETLDALASALNSFEGAVVAISHNQSFLCGFCKELWVVNDCKAEVRHDDSFADMFAQYKREAVAGAADRRRARTAKARMARKANQQRVGGTERSGFIG